MEDLHKRRLWKISGSRGIHTTEMPVTAGKGFSGRQNQDRTCVMSGDNAFGSSFLHVKFFI